MGGGGDYDPNRIAQWIAWFSSGVSSLALANELVHIYYDGTALSARNRAFGAGQEFLRIYDSRFVACLQYWIPSTDLANIPAGLALSLLFHVWNVIFLIAIALEEVPLPNIVPFFDGWLVAFSTESSCAAAGFLQITIGWSLLALPAYALGDYDVRLMRYISAWLLFGTGVVILASGFGGGKKIRIMRCQIKKKDKKPDPKTMLRLSWRAFEAFVETIHADHFANGAFVFTLQQMRDQIKAAT